MKIIMLYNQLTTHNCKNVLLRVCIVFIYGNGRHMRTVQLPRLEHSSGGGGSSLYPPSLPLLRRKLPSLPDGHATVARAAEGRDLDGRV
jgi:hypothetical protein